MLDLACRNRKDGPRWSRPHYHADIFNRSPILDDNHHNLGVGASDVLLRVVRSRRIRVGVRVRSSYDLYSTLERGDNVVSALFLQANDAVTIQKGHWGRGCCS